MKSKLDIEKELGNIKEEEISSLIFMKNEISELVEQRVITPDGIRKMENMIRELEMIRTNHTWRLVRLLQQNHMI